MTERERAINRDLHVLDEAHRLGRLSRAEYRARRRRVLQSLRESSSIVTARKTLLPSGATTTSRTRRVDRMQSAEASADAGRALTTLLSMRPAMAWKPVLAALLGVALLVLAVCWFFLGG